MTSTRTMSVSQRAYLDAQREYDRCWAIAELLKCEHDAEEASLLAWTLEYESGLWMANVALGEATDELLLWGKRAVQRLGGPKWGRDAAVEAFKAAEQTGIRYRLIQFCLSL